MKHWIAMVGMSGYMPDGMCDVYEDFGDAVDSVVSMYELDENAEQELLKTGYVSLHENNSDIEVSEQHSIWYATVDSCDCDEPHIHSEDKVDWCDCPECKPDNENEEQTMLKPGDNATLDIEAYHEWYENNVPFGFFMFDDPNVWIEDVSNKPYSEEPGYAIHSGDSGFSESGIGCAYVPAKFLTPRK